MIAIASLAIFGLFGDTLQQHFSYVAMEIAGEQATNSQISPVSTSHPPSTQESFAAGTLVWTDKGKVAINDIQVGQSVYSRNKTSHQDQLQKVTKTFDRTATGYYLLTSEFETLKVTEEHPLWPQGHGGTILLIFHCKTNKFTMIFIVFVISKKLFALIQLVIKTSLVNLIQYQ